MTVRRGTYTMGLHVGPEKWLRYVLPLPGTRPPLSLNDRTHWRPKARIVAQLREAVTLRAKEARIPRDVDHIDVRLFYAPPDRRTRDADNLVATLKPCIDALTAKGLGRGWPCAGIVADDDPTRVTWHAPTILEPDGMPRYWLEVTIRPLPPGGDSRVVQG